MSFEETRPLPDRILSPSYSRGRKHVVPEGLRIEVKEYGKRIPRVGVKIYSEEGEIAPKEFFNWLIGRNVFIACEGRGEIDCLFRIMDSEHLTHLALYGRTYFNGAEIQVYGREGAVSIRSGNKWGRLNNVIRLCEDWHDKLDTPERVRLAVQEANDRFRKHGLKDIALRSVGQTIQDITLKTTKLQPLPPEMHMYRFLQSFKAGRMEGVLFGASECFDYDITSAYPSMISKLITTNNITWIDSDKIISDAVYAAVRCDVYIAEHLIRGPIGMRYGQKSVYYPIGLLPGVWLNKPEVDLLLQHPELGRIVRIHEASWGIPSIDSYPFRRLMRKLYNMRVSDAYLSKLLKYSMAALWGKFIGTYVVVEEDGSSYTQASCLYNPVFASHVTSEMRCQLYLRSLGQTIIGEFIDGLTTTRELPQNRGFGGFAEQGRGSLVLFSDQYKGSDWKNKLLLETAEYQRDQTQLEVPLEWRHSLLTAYQRYGSKRFAYYIGRSVDFTRRVALGSTSRFIPKQLQGNLRVGDLLETSYQSLPIRFGQIRALRLLRYTDHEATETEQQ